MVGTPTGTGRNYKQIGDDAWKKADKVNRELFALTYGSFVAQLLRDFEDAQQVNSNLEKIGYAMGVRLVDEVIARTPIGRCTDFKETAEIVRMAFRIFLNVNPTITMNGEKEFALSLGITEGDGLGTEWVELPEMAVKGGLRYANLLCGVIKGALEMVHMEVECFIISDPLLNPTTSSTEIKVKFVRFLEEELPPNE